MSGNRRKMRRQAHELQWDESLLRYLVYLPANEEPPSGGWPLVLFLHGVAERGQDLDRVTAHGIPKRLEGGDSLPLVVVCPQCPPDRYWTDLTAELGAMAEGFAAQSYVDESRIYLTGSSMGGYGAWKLAATYPHRFAAVAPVSGGGDPNWAPQLAQLPIWAFHGGEDPVVAPLESIEMVRPLEDLDAPVRLSVFPGAGHSDTWSRVYDGVELYEWLLSHRRPPRKANEDRAGG